jgi:hypothetical protein
VFSITHTRFNGDPSDAPFDGQTTVSTCDLSGQFIQNIDDVRW